MQSPVRLKDSHRVKQLFSDQIRAIQTRHQQDTDLLQDIRSFCKQRSSIEREYAQALQRLAVLHQKRDWQRQNTDSISSDSVWEVWRSLVDAAGTTASVRLTASEEFRSLSLQTSNKENQSKKSVEQLQRIQSELLNSLKDLQHVQKRYHQLSLMAHGAHQKASDAHRARRSDHGFFQFRSHTNSKVTDCDDRLTAARNEYLLQLTALQAHQQHYYSHDLPDILEQMDSSLYEELRAHFRLLCETEMDVCGSTHREHSRICHSLHQVTRERSVQRFLQESPSFRAFPEVRFQPEDHDQVCVLQDVGQSFLQTEMRSCASKAAKASELITHEETVLESLQRRLKLLSGETCLIVEQKISEVQDRLRRAQLSRVKAESCLQLLSLHVSETEACVQLELQRQTLSERTLSRNTQSEELSLTEGEEEEEDWLKMCESCGHVGCEPERYVQFLCLPAEGATSTGTAAVSPVCVQGGEGLWEEDPGHVGVYRSVVVELLEDEEEEEVEEEEILSSGSDPVSSQIHLYNTQQTDRHTDPERSRLSSPVLRPCRPPPPPPIHRSSP